MVKMNRVDRELKTIALHDYKAQFTGHTPDCAAKKTGPLTLGSNTPGYTFSKPKAHKTLKNSL